MTLEETVRNQTREVRQALVRIEARCSDLNGEKDAAEDRLKRAFSEIKRHQTLENERRRLLVDVEAKITEVQQKFDEIERQRQELIERLMERRDEKEKTEKLLREVTQSAESDQHTIRDAKSTIERVARNLGEAETEKHHFVDVLRDACIESLDTHLAELSRRLEQAFASAEERERRQVAVAEFKKARHEDRDIGNLCDQRDQYNDLIGRATVPGVMETLLAALQRVEEELQKRYPDALRLQDTAPEVGSIEELPYIVGPDEVARIFLPVTESAWRAAEDGEKSPATTRAMQFLWRVITSLGLNPENGEFRCDNGRVGFCANAKSFDVNVLAHLSFSMSPQGTSFVLCPVPTEVKEALAYES